MYNQAMRIGIDLGGTKIEIMVLTDSGQLLWRAREATPPGNNYTATLQSLTALVTAGIQQGDKSPLPGLGIGIPGSVCPQTGIIKNANSICLIGQRLDYDLERICGYPVRLANDANCFSLSEAVDGAAAGHPVILGMILGTGVGGGLVIERRVHSGPHAITGEWGHNPMPWPQIWPGLCTEIADERPGPFCYCGKRGCIETFLSGPALAQDHQIASGQALTPADIVALAELEGNNSLAAASLYRYEHRLARTLASLVNIVDPDMIVLGGGLSKITRLYENIPKLIQNWVFTSQFTTKISPPLYGDASGVRGAAWLWPIGQT